MRDYCHPQAVQTAQVVSHAVIRQEMRRAVFCLLLPGDTASSSRLTEIVLAGCIPVFLGPPWHAQPLAARLRYPDFSVFFQLDALS